MGESEIESEGWEGLDFHLKARLSLGLKRSLGFGFGFWLTEGAEGFGFE